MYSMFFSVLDQLQCTVGYPVPGATCGGYLNRQCPDPRRHECVRDEFVPHSEGICCSRSGGKGSFLQIGATRDNLSSGGGKGAKTGFSL